MSDSEDDYMPNGENNLSNMSDVMERSSNHTEIDLDEINDVLLKNLESDVFNMQNEVKQKDYEMQKLLDELQQRYYAERDAEHAQILEGQEDRIRILQEKVDELEESLKQERDQNEKYFAVVETLENENEKLRDENRRQQAEISALNDKIQKMTQSAQNRSTANSSGFMNAPTSPIAGHQNVLQKNGPSDRNRNGLVLDLVEDASQSDFDATGFLKSGEHLTHPIDDVWINKFEFVKEKLSNEQSRNRELEFMIVTQKNIIENTNETISKLKQENKDLEARIEKQRSEIDHLSQARIIEKTKIDSVITFCELMENCVFPRAELVEKLSELPLMISSYLKGTSETIAFNKNQNTNSKLVTAAKKVKAILEQVEENAEKGDKNYKVGLVASELDDIRHGITNLTQFLSKALPPQANTANLNRASTTTFDRRSFRMEGTGFDQEDESTKRVDNKPANNFKSSVFLARAVQNSNSLLFNFKRANPTSRGTSEER